MSPFSSVSTMLNLNVSAWVEVDGQELERYGIDEDPEKNLVTCWIATQPGKNFSIVFRDEAPHRDHALLSSVILDGTKCNAMILLSKRQSRTMVQKDRVTSPTSVRPFVFAKLELTDEDEYLDQCSKHLGEIRIEIFRCHASDRMPCQSQSTSDVAAQNKIHERSKKAVSHCVSFGQEIKVAMQYTRRVTNLDSKPLATFVFKYRDYSLLLANGIIPRPPVEDRAASEEVLDLTSGNDVKREPAGDNVEDLEAAILAMQKKRDALIAKRYNPGASDAPLAKKVKREKFVPTGEVIDLT